MISTYLKILRTIVKQSSAPHLVLNQRPPPASATQSPEKKIERRSPASTTGKISRINIPTTRLYRKVKRIAQDRQQRVQVFYTALVRVARSSVAHSCAPRDKEFSFPTWGLL